MGCETHTSEELRAQFAQIKKDIKDENDRQVKNAQLVIKELLQGNPEGIKIRTLYSQLEERGFTEDSTRSAYLDLAQGDKVDLTSGRHLVWIGK